MKAEAIMIRIRISVIVIMMMVIIKKVIDVVMVIKLQSRWWWWWGGIKSKINVTVKVTSNLNFAGRITKLAPRFCCIS